MFERFIGWLACNVFDALYSGMDIDLDEEDFE